MDIFIKGLGNVSPQHTFAQDSFLEEVVEYNHNALSCIEPNYKDYIDANSARRMGRIIKMGVAASMACLKDAGIQQPDAIITGTGLGCIQDTEKFLSSIIEHGEQLLTPTSFIQSTHNTISAQIALILKCLQYNYTYVHRGFSFESSLLDSLMLLREGTAQHVLLGGADETTPNTFTIMQRLGHWKRQAVSNLNLLAAHSKGTISGEGASFFLLSNEPAENNYAKLVSVTTLYKPADYNEIEATITRFLQDASLEAKEIDLVLFGLNGDVEGDGIYHHLQQNYFAQQPATYFKHLCGEYHTASSFGLWLAAKMIRHQHIPEVVKLNTFSKMPIRNVLIYNHYRNINHSLILLQSC
ncbi:MAG: beta-ketoacyl synthase chain length factor [Bacteroidota bacterium]